MRPVGRTSCSYLTAGHEASRSDPVASPRGLLGEDGHPAGCVSADNVLCLRARFGVCLVLRNLRHVQCYAQRLATITLHCANIRRQILLVAFQANEAYASAEDFPN